VSGVSGVSDVADVSGMPSVSTTTFGKSEKLQTLQTDLDFQEIKEYVRYSRQELDNIKANIVKLKNVISIADENFKDLTKPGLLEMVTARIDHLKNAESFAENLVKTPTSGTNKFIEDAKTNIKKTLEVIKECLKVDDDLYRLISKDAEYIRGDMSGSEPPKQIGQLFGKSIIGLFGTQILFSYNAIVSSLIKKYGEFLTKMEERIAVCETTAVTNEDCAKELAKLKIQFNSVEELGNLLAVKVPEINKLLNITTDNMLDDHSKRIIEGLKETPPPVTAPAAPASTTTTTAPTTTATPLGGGSYKLNSEKCQRFLYKGYKYTYLLSKLT